MPKKRHSKPRFQPRTAALMSRTASWSTNRRLAAGIAALTILAGAAGLTAYLTAGPDDPTKAPAPAATSSPSPAPPAGSGSSGSVGSPPSTHDPVEFAKAAAGTLWSYDTRQINQKQHLAGLKAWMSPETKYTDWESVASQVPDPTLWSRMHDNGQYATAKVSEGHMPQAFTKALGDNPGAITEAYVYVVTVSGKQSISWRGGGAGAEGRAVTLAVQCRPDHNCALSGVSPRVAP
ncbi:hypothetical protein GCM10010218_05360 [Streptomyces mashuensis]|uniref:Uncharacterized protein n=1 Tax=Streptomyces mashuensis TaxID=33904 RepID=A0A919E9H9_9ACTN|nr:hypothetical protein [Streptomyces mashuensis]GHF27350.1 hypothetical protein GCM10010218_05360 [Streptomyces mashuensis]